MLTTTILAALAATTITVSNPTSQAREAVPVVVAANGARSAIVKEAGKEIPCQLDDLDLDGANDELCFITALGPKERKSFTIELSADGEPRHYEPQVYAEMLMSNKKVKQSNKQDLYINSLTAMNGTNPYWMLHHHGPAFENNLVAYRIYFDHRQTVDIYGKYRKGLELKATQFYPDKQQKADGYGDDVLWVGETFGLGALRGWDGKAPQMLKDVERRTLRIISYGPLRTIVEVLDKGWQATPAGRIDMATRYTLYAGRRDCQVDVSFRGNTDGLQLATGVINVKDSREHSDKHGLRGCWGTDWPVSAKDSAGHKRETVGLAILIPKSHIAAELPADKDNYPFVVAPKAGALHYAIAYCSDNETYGFHSADDWFRWMEQWKKEQEKPAVVK